jgi:hypothetical protein
MIGFIGKGSDNNRVVFIVLMQRYMIKVIVLNVISNDDTSCESMQYNLPRKKCINWEKFISKDLQQIIN